MFKNISTLCLVLAAIQRTEAGNGSQNEAVTQASTDSDVEDDCIPHDLKQPKTGTHKYVGKVPEYVDKAVNHISTGKPIDVVPAAGNSGNAVDGASSKGGGGAASGGSASAIGSNSAPGLTNDNNDGDNDDDNDGDTDSSSSSLSASITALLVAVSMVFFY